MLKVALVAALVMGGAVAQARSVDMVCEPNSNATVSQFVASASFFVDDADGVSGTVQFATRASQSAQTSDLHTVSVKGRIVLIPAGELATISIESFQVSDNSNGDLIRMNLNPDLKGPHASNLVINRKDVYSSECRLIENKSTNPSTHD